MITYKEMLAAANAAVRFEVVSGSRNNGTASNRNADTEAGAGHDAWGERGQTVGVTAVERQIVHLPGLHGVVEVGGFAVESGGTIGIDGDRLGLAAKRKRNIEVGCLANCEGDRGGGLLEALLLYYYGVLSGYELCEGVDAFLTALSVADQAGTVASQDDGRVGDDGAGRVRDSAGNGGVLNLCAEGWPRESQKAKQGEESGKRLA